MPGPYAARMAELVPYPFGRLVRRMFHELEQSDSIFHLPRKKFWLGDAAHDCSVQFHGMRASTPLGPAAGPQSQLAQNIVLAWLGGSRIFELKTVQILDELKIPRPCIDMRNIGYNVEWSQELKLEQSLYEYVKAAMLIEMLQKSGKIPLAAGATDVIYDMSVGYDLAGIRSERVQAFLSGMRDASAVIDVLRREIPDEFVEFRDLPFRSELSRSLTLSTFHGCPPDEIEKIIDFLLREVGLHCIIKLNPTLLGPHEARRLLNDVMGYADARIPDSAFANDTQWDQALGFIERLQATAAERGLGLGVKCSNTLIVEHDGEFLPASEQQKYLSGPPLHVLAMNLVQRLRRHFGSRIPISFSAGIDRGNFADAVALGLVPVTVCSDLLKPGGYARQVTYLAELQRRMDVVGAKNIDEFIVKAYGEATTTGDGDQRCRNTEFYVPQATVDARYALIKNNRLPKKVGSTLELFNCLTCDKCIPVCPNDANFPLLLPPRQVPVQKLRKQKGSWEVETFDSIVLETKHQIANFADFCNECGNCDIFCPEDGGPYVMKPRFFGSFEEWKKYPTHDGFFVQVQEGAPCVYGRFNEREYSICCREGRVRYEGDHFAVTFARDDIAASCTGTARGDVDLTWFYIMDLVREAILESEDVNFANA